MAVGGRLCAWTLAGLAVTLTAAVRADRVFRQRRRSGRLRGRRHAGHLQHQHRRRRRVGRSAGLRPHADRLRLSRPRRAGRRRPRLRHGLGRRRFAAGARLPDRRQRGLLRRQAGDLRRSGARPGRPNPGRFPGFDAASQAGYVDIANVDCLPGQKKARVSFVPDRSVVDYTQLFTATSMMPSHVIADQLNVDVTAALLGNNWPGGGADRAAVEHHLGPQARPNWRPRNASRRRGRTRSSRCWTAARWCSSPTTAGGAPRRSPSGSPCGRREPTSRTGSTTAASTSSTSRPGRRERWPHRTTTSAPIRRRPASSS